jgi:predicted RNA-binding protein Jag
MRFEFWKSGSKVQSSLSRVCWNEWESTQPLRFNCRKGLFLEIKGDQEGILIGKRRNTLEALQTLISRMIIKQRREPVRVAIDIEGYKKR